MAAKYDFYKTPVSKDSTKRPRFHATTTNVLEAQTAWLEAQSEKIDAEIDTRLCEVYLAKALGTMKY